MFMKKVTLSLIACAASLFSALSQGAIISSFDTQVNVDISSTFVSSEFQTFLCCDEVYEEGSVSGNASGTGYGGPVTLAANDIGDLDAKAIGEVTGLGGYVDSVWSTSGTLLIDNRSGQSSINGDVSFDISWSANIFTDSLYSGAFSGAWLYVENSDDEVIFDDYIEFDSFVDSPGGFGALQTFSINVWDVTIAAGGSEQYDIGIGAVGFAYVPEPGGVLLAGLALLFALRKRKMSA
jgi:hypothetical protein